MRVVTAARMRTFHKYELIVFRSGEDSALVVDVPELPGCMAHGATAAEAVANAQDAIDLGSKPQRPRIARSPRPGAVG